MYELNEKIRDLEPYIPSEDNYQVKLDANESFVRVPDYILSEALQKYATVKLNRYPDPSAKELCENFANYYGISPDFVTAGNGSDEIISIIMNGFLMSGEKFATFKYDFSMYDFYGHLAGAECVKISQNDDFSVDVDRVIETCKNEKVRLLIFSNPCNPTSLGIERDEVRKIITELDNTLIVLDEAYMDFWNQSLINEAEKYDNLIILRTCSKAFGMAALRVGIAVANTKLTNIMRAIKSPFNVNSVSQLVAGTVLKHKGEANVALRQIKESTAELLVLLKKMNQKYGNVMTISETCTNFITVKMPKFTDLFLYLKEKGIIIRCFKDFLRITAGSHSENKELLRFVEKFMSENFTETE